MRMVAILLIIEAIAVEHRCGRNASGQQVAPKSTEADRTGTKPPDPLGLIPLLVILEMSADGGMHVAIQLVDAVP